MEQAMTQQAAEVPGQDSSHSSLYTMFLMSRSEGEKVARTTVLERGGSTNVQTMLTPRPKASEGASGGYGKSFADFDGVKALLPQLTSTSVTAQNTAWSALLELAFQYIAKSPRKEYMGSIAEALATYTDGELRATRGVVSPHVDSPLHTLQGDEAHFAREGNLSQVLYDPAVGGMGGGVLSAGGSSPEIKGYGDLLALCLVLLRLRGVTQSLLDRYSELQKSLASHKINLPLQIASRHSPPLSAAAFAEKIGTILRVMSDSDAVRGQADWWNECFQPNANDPPKVFSPEVQSYLIKRIAQLHSGVPKEANASQLGRLVREVLADDQRVTREMIAVTGAPTSETSGGKEPNSSQQDQQQQQQQQHRGRSSHRNGGGGGGGGGGGDSNGNARGNNYHRDRSSSRYSHRGGGRGDREERGERRERRERKECKPCGESHSTPAFCARECTDSACTANPKPHRIMDCYRYASNPNWEIRVATFVDGVDKAELERRKARESKPSGSSNHNNSGGSGGGSGGGSNDRGRDSHRGNGRGRSSSRGSRVRFSSNQ
jgi:hypothetical protein